MKQKIVCILLVLIGLSSYTATAQIKFKKGYIITKDGEKINCFIKDKEWSYDPPTYTYKRTKEGTVSTIDTKNIKELKIANRVFVRKLVDIDVPANGTYSVKLSKETKTVSKELLLERIVNGDVKLYIYTKNNFKKFFFEKNNKVVQLLYKKYLDDNKIKEDNLFRKQLWNNFKCEGDKISDFSRVDYTRKELVAILVKYSKCTNLTVEVSKEKKASFKELVNISPKLGVSLLNTTMKPLYLSGEFTTKINAITISYGGEIEFFLPLFNKKLSVVGSYLAYDFDDSLTYTNNGIRPHLNGTTNIDYQSSNLSIGLRYYFYLKNEDQLFTSLNFSNDQVKGNFNYNASQSGIRYADVNLDMRDSYITFGIGYKRKKAFVELLFSTVSTSGIEDSAPAVAVALGTWSFNRNVLSINFGYNIF